MAIDIYIRDKEAIALSSAVLDSSVLIPAQAALNLLSAAPQITYLWGSNPDPAGTADMLRGWNQFKYP